MYCRLPSLFHHVHRGLSLFTHWGRVSHICVSKLTIIIQRSCWGVYWFHSVRLSVRLSRLPCPLCNICSSGWILSILATIDHYHERVCRTQWPLTLTYIFKVIRPWLWKSCPLCIVYSSGWILFIFGKNDHYHYNSLGCVSRVMFFSESENLNFWQIFEIFRPWPWWILSIFDTNDH